MSTLEFFEIVYRMKSARGVTLRDTTADINDEQMFFVPSLLKPLVEGEIHPALSHYHKIVPRSVFIVFHCLIVTLANLIYRRVFMRRFMWEFYPSGFVPRLLLRLVHLRMTLLKSWYDGAIILSQNGTECAHVQLSKIEAQESTYQLEVIYL